MTAQTLCEALDAACGRWPTRPALSFRGRHTTYGELGRQVDALAAAYRRMEIARGDRVVCQLSNRPEHLVAAFAAWRCGAVHVGAHPQLTARELSTLVGLTGAVLLVHEPAGDEGDPLATLARDHPRLRLFPAEGAAGEGSVAGVLAGADAGTPPPPGNAVDGPSPEDAAALLVTSGSTGKPKLPMGFHGRLAASWTGLARGLGLGPDDVHLAHLPLAHGFGLMLATAGLLGGGRVLLVERFSPAEVLESVGREGVTVLHGSAAHFRLLLDRLDPALHDLRSLRVGVASASAFPIPLLRAMLQGLGMTIMMMYGSSEGVGVATTDPDEILMGSVGRPEPGSVAIVDGRRRPVAAGAPGEIAFSRAVFPVRYWSGPEGGQPRSVTRGWYYTGDLGRIDPDGRLFVLGRVQHRINRGGSKVDPAEVEAALLGCAGVAEAAVIGTPHPVLGETVCAIVVPSAGPAPTLSGVRAELAGLLAAYKLPEALRIVPAIPRSLLGKVDVERLRAEVLETAGA
ncbi:MAG TPA: class I adenylate-forming enzyme family protein [Longimicrobium sp.]|nr:class I adenylate-forming enzyme family protein [Longimicrobium sp.]